MSTTERQSFNLYQLIGAPLVAFVQAECKVAQTTAEFIQRMGFLPGPDPGEPEAPDSLGRLRMVTFVHERRGSDGETRKYKVEVPLLSLLPIPTMQVKEADIEFALKIFELRRQPGALPAQELPIAGARRHGAAGPSSDFLGGGRYEMVGAMGRTPPAGERDGSLDNQLKVKVRLEQADMPAGLAHLLRLMDESVKATLLEDSPANETET